MDKFFVSSNIEEAETLPSSFYKNEKIFKKIRDNIFLKSWHFVGDESTLLPLSLSAYPFILLDNYLSEPIVLIKNEHDDIKSFSNVCTHRGNIIINNPGKHKSLICNYHGRRFNLSGEYKSMPEFSEVKNFPRACDNLNEFKNEKFGPFIFVGLNPKYKIKDSIKIMKQRISFLNLEQFKFDSNMSKEYLVNSHWALYCDNYLDGFHIPFVHNDLNKVLDYDSYETVVYDKMCLQIGYSNGSEEIFDLPNNHPDYGKEIAAYYYWIFPNIMFNFYPWGLSVNIVKPISLNQTKVSFKSYIYDKSKLNKGAGAILDKVEREDEFVVEGVQKGITSSFYKTGRFSPKREKGVHLFHRLLAEFVNSD
jgi:choline monooxygenase